MTHILAIKVELPPGYRALESPDVTIGVGNALPYGAFAATDGREYKFKARKSGEIVFITPLPKNTDPLSVGRIERAILQIIAFKRARRAAERDELGAFERARRRTRAGSGR